MKTLRAGSLLLALTAAISGAALLRAQTTSRSLEPVLNPPIQPVPVTAFQLQQCLMKRIPKLVPATSAEQWKAEAQKLRKHLLDDIAFHGWPR